MGIIIRPSESPKALIYRSMFEQDGKPQCGREKSRLGVRPGIDMKSAPDGTVRPGAKGMSVAPSLGAMKDFLIPERLRDSILEAEGATGDSDLRVWKMGKGPFLDAPLTRQLALRVTSPTHGQVEPNAVMPSQVYEDALYSTRDAWEVDEGGTPL